MDKALQAKLLGWGQLFLVAVGTSIQAHGIPSTAAQWQAIIASAAVALALHHASSTDGTK